ncbi:MAG: hypothetical protein ACR2IT_04990 [Pirellulales bacterium]
MPSCAFHHLIAFTITAIVGVARCVGSDLPPHVVSDFTRKVQPLIVNKCAAGACHGGPTAHEPAFERGPTSGRLDRSYTLANMAALLDTIGTDRNPRQLITLLAAKHPATPSKSGLAASPLTARERITLESWLAAVRAAETGRRFDPAVQQASATVEATPKGNRFRDLLDAAAMPQELPPPQEPQGVIFKKDDQTSDAPPLAPSPPIDP